MSLFHAPSIHVEAANQHGAFGIFEVIDCKRPGAKPMTLIRGEDEEKYCVAAKPIVDQTYLKRANSQTDGLGSPVLVNEDGARAMRSATQRVMSEHAAKGDHGSLAFVVKGKLLTTADLMNVIEDQLALTFSTSGFTREEVDELANFLMGRQAAPPAGLSRS